MHGQLKVLGTDSSGFVHNGVRDGDTNPDDRDFFRVFIFGGSTVYGVGVDENRLTIASFLERFLERRYHKVKVINCGVKGYMSWQQMTYMAHEIIGYKPDYVVVLDGLNDFSKPAQTQQWIPNSDAYSCDISRNIDLILEPRLAFLRRLTVRLLEKHPVWKKLIRLLGQLKSELEALAEESTDVSPKYIALQLQSVDWYIRNVCSMIGIAAYNEIRIAYLLQPQLVWGARQPTEQEHKFLKELYAYEPFVSDLAQQWHHLASQKFDAAKEKLHNGHTIWLENAGQWLDEQLVTVYSSWNHYNSRGNEVIAERIGRIIFAMDSRQTNHASFETSTYVQSQENTV